MAIVIAPMEEKHAEGFHACIDSVAREKRYLAMVEAPPLESTRAFVKENVAAGQVQFAALDGERVVGWCDIRRPLAGTFSHVGTVGMGLLPAYRGQGIGKQILTRAIDAAFAAGIERIELMVYATNAPAIRLYRSLGFSEEGRMVAKAKIDGAYLDMVCMTLFRDAGFR